MGVRARYELVPPLHPAFDYWAPQASASAQVHNSCKGLSIWVHQFAGIYRAEFVPTVIREAPNPVGITEFSAIFGKKADAGWADFRHLCARSAVPDVQMESVLHLTSAESSAAK